MKLRRYRREVAFLAVALAATVPGCGSDDDRVDPEVVGNKKTLSVVSPEMIAKAPPGSPQRTVLRWWRLMQYRAAPGALKLFTPEVQARLRKTPYEATVYCDFGPWLKHVRPKISGVDRKGGEAIVTLDIVIRQPVGPELYRQSADLVGMSLRRTRRGWRIADTTFFVRQSLVLRKDRLKGQGGG